jgi:hypothetical protein
MAGWGRRRARLQGLDWRDDKHWSCNDNVHPSRHGTYDGITMHPFETVFIKASWHVGEPFTSRYTRWFSGHALGQASQCRISLTLNLNLDASPPSLQVLAFLDANGPD